MTDFSGVYEAEGFLPWLREQDGEKLVHADFTLVEGTCCYCSAQEVIMKELPVSLPLVRWTDSGDYHYMTHLLALRETEPFHLILLDHHPDNQEPVFGDVLSCGGWVKTMQETNPLLRSVLSIGPEDCPEDVPDAWLAQRRGERVYVSLDKDVMGRAWSRTDWTQGTHSLEQVKDMLRRILLAPVELAALDICGEITESKGATPEDLRMNLETNKVLYNHIKKFL